MHELPPDHVVARAVSAARDRVMQVVLETSPRLSRRFWRAAGTAVAAPVLVGCAVGAVVLTAQPEADVRGDEVACYRTASLADEPNLLIADTDELADEAVEACQHEWRTGRMTGEGADNGDDLELYPSPLLTACVRTDGLVSVFPGTDTRDLDNLCGRLGLARWEPAD